MITFKPKFIRALTLDVYFLARSPLSNSFPSITGSGSLQYSPKRDAGIDYMYIDVRNTFYLKTALQNYVQFMYGINENLQQKFRCTVNQEVILTLCYVTASFPPACCQNCKIKVPIFVLFILEYKYFSHNH